MHVAITFLVALSVLCYGLAMGFTGEGKRLGALAFSAGWVGHALALLLHAQPGDAAGAVGVRFGFAAVLSLTVWLVIAVHAIESRLLPLPGVRRALAFTGAVSLALVWSFPGEARAATSTWAPLHWVLGVASYGLFGAAVLHATMLDAAERQLRTRSGRAIGVLGLPLLRLERLTFRFVECGFAALTAAVVLGMLTSKGWRWDHKTVFSLLGWTVFAALLVGRHRYGWRGQLATRWVYVGALLLLLAYVGSRFVMEVLLTRSL